MGQNTAFGVDHIPPKVCELLQTSGWRKFIIPYEGKLVEYGENEFERFVETSPPRGLGQSVETLKAICGAANMPESVTVSVKRTSAPATWRESARRRIYNITPLTSKKGGTSADYALRRLKRDRPDLAAKVIAGELSTHRAAVIAGFRKKYFQVPRDPAKLTRKLIAVFGFQWAMQLANLILKNARCTVMAHAHETHDCEDCNASDLTSLCSI